MTIRQSQRSPAFHVVAAIGLTIVVALDIRVLIVAWKIHLNVSAVDLMTDIILLHTVERIPWPDLGCSEATAGSVFAPVSGKDAFARAVLIISLLIMDGCGADDYSRRCMEVYTP